MNISIDEKGSSKIAKVESDEVIISSVNDALDFLASINHEHACEKALLQKNNLAPEFYDLSTGLAGDILQKFVNYGLKIAIVGDFSTGISNSLRDFIYECNNGNHICFSADDASALKSLHSMR